MRKWSFSSLSGSFFCAQKLRTNILLSFPLFNLDLSVSLAHSCLLVLVDHRLLSETPYIIMVRAALDPSEAFFHFPKLSFASLAFTNPHFGLLQSLTRLCSTLRYASRSSVASTDGHFLFLLLSDFLCFHLLTSPRFSSPHWYRARTHPEGCHISIISDEKSPIFGSPF